MLDQLVQKFMGSDACKQSLRQLTGQGLNDTQARDAIAATAEGAAAHLGPDPGSGLGGTSGSLPQHAVDGIASQVASRTGLSPTISRAVVNAVLPRVLEFVRNNMGVTGAP